MKKILALFCLLSLLVVMTTGSLATDYSFLDDLELSELMDIRDEVDARIDELSPTDDSDDDEDFGTRTNPVIVGDRVTYTSESYLGSNVVEFEIVYAIRGEPANALLKSFNKYNTRSMAKDEEWFIVLMNIKAVDSDNDKVDLNSYNFTFVSENGVEYDTGYISDNPMEVKSLYVGAEQLGWIGYKIKLDDMPLIVYDDFDGTVWFNPNVRLETDPPQSSIVAIDKSSDSSVIEDLQYRLMELGMSKTVPTGKYDKDTISAVRKYQKAMGLENTDGQADEETVRSILSNRPLPEEE